jgi:YggT family protein
MIRVCLNIYIIVLIVDALLTFLPKYNKHPWALQVKKVADFSLTPVRKMLPPDLPFDFSPLVVILFIQILKAIW